MRCRLRLLALLAIPAFALSLSADEPRTLFNGRDLTGWVAEGITEYKDGDKVKPIWQVREGLLHCDGKGFGFLRYAEREYADFRWHLEFRLAAKCNSGIGIRTVPFDPKRSTATRPSYACYEIQLVDDSGKPPTKHSSGSLYRYVAPTVNPFKPAGEWNAMVVECVGPQIRVTVNSVRILDVDQTTIPELKAKPLKGYVCLQNHGGKIDFRNLRIEDLAKR